LKKKIKHSNFGFVINTNKRIEVFDPTLKDYCNFFEEKLNNLFYEIQTGKHIILKEGEWNNETVKEIQIKSVIERGSKTNTIHSHILLGISHYIKIHLDKESLRDSICKKLEISGCYISDFRILRSSWETDLENFNAYIEKNIVE